MLVPVGRGVSLDVADAGRGPVIVLLHGWPVTSLHWRHVIPVLNRAGFRTLAIEPRGLGDVSTGPGEYAKPVLAREVIAVLDALGVRRFVVAGHAVGGVVAALIAAEQPSRITGLVLEETVPRALRIPIPSPGHETHPDWHTSLLRAPGALAETMLRGRFDVFVDAFLTQSAGVRPLDFDAHLAYVGAYSSDSGLEASLGLFRSVEPDATAMMRAARRRIRIPGLAIGGRYGMGGAVAESLSRLVAGARGVVVPDAGHYPAEQSADVVNTALVQFLRSIH